MKPIPWAAGANDTQPELTVRMDEANFITRFNFTKVSYLNHDGWTSINLFCKYVEIYERSKLRENERNLLRSKINDSHL